MFEQLKEMIEKVDKELNEIVPAEVVLKMDKDGNGSIKCEGRNKEIFMLIGNLLANISRFDEEKLEITLEQIRSACEVNFKAHESEDGDAW